MKIWALLLFTSVSIFAKIAVVNEAPGIEAPWFTGPLITASATTVPVGHVGFEPYLYVTKTPARYNNDWHSKSIKELLSVTFQPYVWIGLTNWADLQIAPVLTWNDREGPSHWNFGDLPIKLEFQVYRDALPHKSWIPSIKFGIIETFPTGKYKNLNPKKLYTDQGGLGAYSTTLQLVFGRLIQLKGVHWAQLRLSLNYILSTPVHVKGFNAYGGGYGAHGRVLPGQLFAFEGSFEFSLTRNWAIACDFVGEYQGTNRFKGNPGTTPAHLIAIDRTPAAILYTIAPALEYNWSQTVGLIAGAQIGVAGKNSPISYSGVIAFNYYQ